MKKTRKPRHNIGMFFETFMMDGEGYVYIGRGKYIFSWYCEANKKYKSHGRDGTATALSRLTAAQMAARRGGEAWTWSDISYQGEVR